jgi:dTDP-4-dehydrorhamnose reductase
VALLSIGRVKLLVLGAEGMLGQDVVRAAELAGHEVTGLGRAGADVTDHSAVRRAVEQAAPQVVVNCAAYTAVDAAEDEPEAAMRVNADGARTVASVASRAGAAVVYVSSDYVFDGTKDVPYVESDEPAPLSSYGRSKLAGEIDTAAVNPRHFIVRSSWLFGTARRNFVETMIELGSKREEIRVVDDQVGSPTYTAHLAEGLVRLAATDAHGLHHMSAGGRASWYEFAVDILESTGSRCRVLPTTTEEFGAPAPRPRYSVLATQREEAIHLPNWQVGLAAYLRER